jgi:hypothetical protein
MNLGFYVNDCCIHDYREVAPSDNGDISYYRSSWWSWSPCSDAPPIINDIAEVIPITVVFPHVAVLGDAAPCVVVISKALVVTN